MSATSQTARPKWLWIAVALAVVAALVLPFLVKNYRVFQFNLVLVYAIAILGLNILTGFNGQISLGHGAFYAIGAYGAAILMDRFGVPYWATPPLAGALCFLFGFLMGFPALRLSGHYLAVATLGLALAVPQLLKYKHLEEYTGGVQGIVLVKPDPPFTFRFLDQPFNADRWLYFFTLAVTVVMFVLAWNLLRGRVGRALIAIRDHPIAAATMGINLPMFKSLTFGVSAAFTGVGGALGAIAIAFVSPDSFLLPLSIFLLVGMVVGGLASIPGAFFGAIFIQYVPNIADELSKSAPAAIYGVLLIVLMYLMPTGVMGMLRRLWARWQPGAARLRVNPKPGASVPVQPDLTKESTT
ncbi:MAG TPA: branched-chain amino acid ABC transporter permease [Burkholderiaceae bacterium]|nr:branched-chain amino acid ABC transporter permease [Burkholderiaceae bacterium]